ncbi:MAG: dodecin [Alkalispirochaetaceae bacterium]
MSEHTYKKIEIVGSSQKGLDDAIENAIARTGETISDARWFEVTEIRGHIEGGKIAHWQVGVKIGFTMRG